MTTTRRRLLPALLAAAVIPFGVPAIAHAAAPSSPAAPQRTAHRHAAMPLATRAMRFQVRGDVTAAPAGGR